MSLTVNEYILPILPDGFLKRKAVLKDSGNFSVSWYYGLLGQEMEGIGIHVSGSEDETSSLGRYIVQNETRDNFLCIITFEYRTKRFQDLFTDGKFEMMNLVRLIIKRPGNYPLPNSLNKVITKFDMIDMGHSNIKNLIVQRAAELDRQVIRLRNE
jgi:hypothetical protein